MTALALALAATTARGAPVPSSEIMLSQGEQDLGTALLEVGRVAGREIIVTDAAVAGRRAPALVGRFSLEAAIERLLAGTGITPIYQDGAILIGAPAAAALALDRSERVQRDEVVITGSSIRGVVPAGSPSVILDRAAIERSGYATTQQLLQALPQAYRGGPNEASYGISQVNGSEFGQFAGASINLRGLGAGSTLTLLNGHRVPLGGYGSFADVSLIPASAIERIEVLTDGASAIYGADAVAGVANVVLRDTYEGAETRLRFGSADGHANEVQASQLLGARWSTGHLLVAYEYYRRGRLLSADRDFASEDLRALGGGDYRSGYGVPGTILVGAQAFPIPGGQDGTALTPDQLVPGPRNRSDSRAIADLLPRQARHSAYAAAEQALTDGLDLFGDLLFSRRSFSNRARLDLRSIVTVPVTNPFYVAPPGVTGPVRVEYDFARELGPLDRQGASRTLSATLGLRQAIGAWRLQAYGVHGRQADVDRTTNYVNSFRVARALAMTDPATALNVFGDGSYANPGSVLDDIRGGLRINGAYRFWSATAKADGPLFDLPGGPVRAAVGVEYRRETARSRLVSDLSGPEPSEQPYLVFPGARRVTSAFGELYVPLVGEANARPWLERLSLSLAGRVEHYNDFGGTTNPKLGLTWEPLGGIRLRGSYGRSFRAPPFINLIQTSNSRFFYALALPDPRAAGGQSNVLVKIGNDPDLGPERARTWTIGLDLKPRALVGLSASLSYFNIAYRDRIVDPSGSLTSFLLDRASYGALLDEAPSAAAIAAIFAQPEFTDFGGIGPEEIDIIADARVQNLASVRQSGLDVDLGYTFDLGSGRADLGLAGTYLFHARQRIIQGAPATDLVDTIGNPVDLRLRGRAGWAGDAWSVSAFANYTDAYRNTLLAARPRVRSYMTVDLQLGYTVPAGRGALSGLSVSVNATNAFDRGPPFVEYYTGTTAIGYDPENASALGRSVALQVTKSW